MPYLNLSRLHIKNKSSGRSTMNKSNDDDEDEDEKQTTRQTRRDFRQVQEEEDH